MIKILINILSYCLFTLFTLSCASQINFADSLSKSRNKLQKLSYVDSSGSGYERGDIGGMNVDIRFYSVKFDKNTEVVNVEGIAIVFANKKDTVGFCCMDFFIARPVNGYLTRIRKLGETNSSQNGDQTKKDGYFSFKIKLDKSDRLYFIGGDGKGLEEYNIGKICFETMSKGY